MQEGRLNKMYQKHTPRQVRGTHPPADSCAWSEGCQARTQSVLMSLGRAWDRSVGDTLAGGWQVAGGCPEHRGVFQCRKEPIPKGALNQERPQI